MKKSFFDTYILLFLLTFLTGSVLPLPGISQELPRGSTENCLYIMPIFESIRVPGSLTLEVKRAQILKMKQQLGNGNLYHRLGFSFIYSPGADAEVRQVCTLSKEYGVHLGLIFGLQSHSRDDLRAIASNDLRLFQWRKDGNDWKGSFTSTGTVEVPEDQRDYKIPTPSRYATPLKEYNAVQALAWAESAKKLMTDFPGVVTCINGPIEEELAIGGMSNTEKLADYSPFAITEFRDWLRHSGLYDASSGKFAGEGASKLIVGDLISFNGTLRSQFYDDPTPDDNNGTGVSFNQFFGTNFTTWSLRYWDLDIYTEAITDVNFDCTPEAGTGFCSGGFDAPRILDAKNKYWKAWSYDIPDQGGIYPAGNPSAPAYGFRQNLTHNMVRDLFEVIASTGLPRAIMYAHQIPGEALANFTGEAPRNRSSASTIWSGLLEKSKTVGITRFGDINPALMTQYADDWGIFEWHTAPNADPGTQALYTASINALNNYYQHKVHFLFPGWWSVTAPDNSSIFPLNDSRFADAIKDFMTAREEVPYSQQGTSHDYAPPKVLGITGFIDEKKVLNVKWSERIWLDLLQKWNDWGQFANFEIQLSQDGSNWSQTEKTSIAGFTKSLSETSCKIRVRAISKKGLAGVWSETVSINSQPDGTPLQIAAQYNSLFVDPEVTNMISVSVGDPSRPLNPDSLAISITGEGRIWDTAPDNVSTIEKFWPMNSSSDVTGLYDLDNVNFDGGWFNATVSPKTPIDPYLSFVGSSLNGSQLPYIAFRLYSDLASGGQLYWFINGGNKVISFPIIKGWNVYTFGNLPDWISQSTINSVRLDPGTTANAKITLDWFAISSHPISTSLRPSFTVNGNQATILTSSTTVPGSYTVTATFNKLSASTTVQTKATNLKPVVKMLLPVKDTTVVLGTTIRILAEAKDTDGKLSYVNYLANSSFIQKVSASPYLFDWTPGAAGSYQLAAEAVDNASESTKSSVKNIMVIEPKPWLGVNPVLPGVIEAEDYDIGGEAITYHDTDPNNRGGVYRTDGVDILKKSDNLHGFFISWTEVGEWLSYTVDVKKSAKMDINLLIASKAGGGEIHLEMNDKPLTNHLVITGTGDDQQFRLFSFKDVYFKSGLRKLKVVIDKGGINLDYIEIAERIVTGINDLILLPGNILYPNPAHDWVKIRVLAKGKVLIRIVGLNGQLMRLLRLPEEDEYSVSVADLPQGIYVVWIITEGNIFKQKLIKI
ncbi:MAG: Ig-like domain-containing protein [Prolixibacteraceae bacterium]